MGAVRLLFHTELRRRWQSWVVIALLISVVAGLVLAAAAAGRRTDAAFPRFVAAHGFDAVVYATRPVPQVAHLPGVTSATKLTIPDTGNPTCDCSDRIDQGNVAVAVAPARDPSLFTLVSGHLPNPANPDQVLASFTMQQDFGVQVGTQIRVPFEAPSQSADYNNPNTGLPNPKGPRLTFVVVGIEASEFEFPSGTTPAYFLYADQAFARTVLPHTGVQYQYYVRLRDGAAGITRFEDQQVKTLNLGTGTVGASSEDGEAATIQASIHPQAIGWWILAALAALVGLAVIGQALGRQSSVESEDYPTLAALGVGRPQLLLLGMARTLVVGVVGAIGAVGVAVVLSPIAPLGEARMAEASTSFAFDTLVLPIGALATVTAVLALGLWPGLRAARTLRPDDRAATERPSAVVAQLVALGAPPTAVIGVRNALERRSGGSTIPLGSAILGMVLAVIALCGTGVFGASLTHLTATPRLWGDPEQVSFDPPNPSLLRSLEDNKAVTALTEGVGGGLISVNNMTVGAIAGTSLRGPLLFSTVDGRSPNGDDQIGMGVTTMRLVGAHLGSVIEVTVTTHSGTKRTEPFRVVSQNSFPQLGGFVSLGTGTLLTTSGLQRAECLPGPTLALCRQKVGGVANGGIRVTFVSGPRGKVALNHYLATYSSITSKPLTPTSLVNFGEAVNFPLIFGAMLAIFGAATLAHLLVVSVARRRKEVGLLKVLGFVNGQVVSTVAWQATTLAVVGIVLGIPLGVVIGRTVWNAFANNLGVVPDPVIPVLLTVVLAAGVLVAANVIAIAPALFATRSKPAELLRTSQLNGTGRG